MYTCVWMPLSHLVDLRPFFRAPHSTAASRSRPAFTMGLGPLEPSLFGVESVRFKRFKARDLGFCSDLKVQTARIPKIWDVSSVDVESPIDII